MLIQSQGNCSCQRAAEFAAQKEGIRPIWKEFRLYGPPDGVGGIPGWEEQRAARRRHQEKTRREIVNHFWKIAALDDGPEVTRGAKASFGFETLEPAVDAAIRDEERDALRKIRIGSLRSRLRERGSLEEDSPVYVRAAPRGQGSESEGDGGEEEEEEEEEEETEEEEEQDEEEEEET